MNKQVIDAGVGLNAPSNAMELRFYTSEVNSNKMLGKLYEKGCKLHFEGDVDESAKKFTDHLCEYFTQRIDEIVADRVKDTIAKPIATGDTITLSTTYRVVEPE